MVASGEKGTAFTLLTSKDVQFAAALVRNLVSLFHQQIVPLADYQ